MGSGGLKMQPGKIIENGRFGGRKIELILVIDFAVDYDLVENNQRLNFNFCVIFIDFSIKFLGRCRSIFWSRANGHMLHVHLCLCMYI